MVEIMVVVSGEWLIVEVIVVNLGACVVMGVTLLGLLVDTPPTIVVMPVVVVLVVEVPVTVASSGKVTVVVTVTWTVDVLAARAGEPGRALDILTTTLVVELETNGEATCDGEAAGDGEAACDGEAAGDGEETPTPILVVSRTPCIKIQTFY